MCVVPTINSDRFARAAGNYAGANTGAGPIAHVVLVTKSNRFNWFYMPFYVFYIIIFFLIWVWSNHPCVQFICLCDFLEFLNISSKVHSRTTFQRVKLPVYMVHSIYFYVKMSVPQ